MIIILFRLRYIMILNRFDFLAAVGVWFFISFVILVDYLVTKRIDVLAVIRIWFRTVLIFFIRWEY